MILSSIDYVCLISWVVYKRHNFILNKIQIQALLFICYGIYFSIYKKPLFNDDKPKACFIGPVFIHSYIHYKEHFPTDLTIDKKALFIKNKEILNFIIKIIDSYYSFSMNDFLTWFHRKNNPWAKTVLLENGNKLNLNKEIDGKVIIDYFNNKEWKFDLVKY